MEANMKPRPEQYNLLDNMDDVHEQDDITEDKKMLNHRKDDEGVTEIIKSKIAHGMEPETRIPNGDYASIIFELKGNSSSTGCHIHKQKLIEYLGDSDNCSSDTYKNYVITDYIRLPEEADYLRKVAQILYPDISFDEYLSLKDRSELYGVKCRIKLFRERENETEKIKINLLGVIDKKIVQNKNDAYEYAEALEEKECADQSDNQQTSFLETQPDDDKHSQEILNVENEEVDLLVNEKYTFIHDLQEEEYEKLKKSIQADGLRDKIVVIKDEIGDFVIIDGHHRKRICDELGIEIKRDDVFEKKFDNDDEIIDWMLENQVGRRNSSTIDKCKTALNLLEHFQSRIKRVRVNDPKQKWDVYEELAKRLNVSSKTIKRYRTIQLDAAKDIRQSVESGALSINAATKKMKRSEPNTVSNNKDDISNIINEDESPVEDTKANVSWKIIDDDRALIEYVKNNDCKAIKPILSIDEKEVRYVVFDKPIVDGRKYLLMKLEDIEDSILNMLKHGELLKDDEDAA